MLVGLIPARGGSKGIKHKNLAVVGNKSLLQIGIQKLFDSGCDKVIVSSDSKEILEIAETFGALRHLRNECLSNDDATTYSLVKHLIGLEVFASEDILALHQITSPLLRSESIKHAVNKLVSSNGEVKSIFGAFLGNHIIWVENEEQNWDLLIPEKIRLPRQKRTKSVLETGGIYVAFVRDIILQGQLLPKPTGIIELNFLESLDIDIERDLQIANKLLKFT
jgi:N-acylneuraminate cytidylyltransferase